MSVHVIYIVKAHRSCPEKWSDKIIKENGIFSMEKIVGSALEAFLIGRVKKYELKTAFLLFNIRSRKKLLEVLRPLDQAYPFA